MKEPKIVMVGIGSAGIGSINAMAEDSALKETIKTVAIFSSLDQDDILHKSKADEKIEIDYETVDYLDGKVELEIVKLFKNKSEE